MKNKSTDVPASVVGIIATLRAERAPLAARLDAIDLAIENLGRVYGLNGQPQADVAAPRKASKAKPAQAMHLVGDDGEAAARRDVLLGVISKSSVGLTLAELRKQTPKMDGKARSNALQIMKAKQQIRRSGNAWIAA